MSDQTANTDHRRLQFHCDPMRSPLSPRELQRFFYCNTFNTNLNESREVSGDKLKSFPWIIVIQLESQELGESYVTQYFTRNSDGEPGNMSQFREWKPEVDSELIPQFLELNGFLVSDRQWVWEYTQVNEDRRSCPEKSTYRVSMYRASSLPES